MASDCLFVTGGTGFVGRHLVKALCARGKRVRAVIRPGKEKFFEEQGLSVETILTEDLFAESSAWWKEAYQEVDTVIHCAWFAKVGEYRSSPKNIDCLIGTLQMSMEAVACGVRRFVGIGTFSEYDERYGARLTVETPLLPTDMYENAKVAAFYALSNFFKLSDTSFSWCRLFSMYGEGEDPKRLVPYIRQQLAAGKPAELTDGCQVRDFLEVSEAARKVVDIALGEEQGPKNICSSKPIMIRDLAKKIAEEYGRPDLLRFGVHQRADTDPFAMVGVE